MNQKHLITFVEGMDKDTDFHRYPNTRYSHAENFRFIYDEEHSNGILTNEVGNTLKFNITGILLGWTTLRDNLILFVLGMRGTTHIIQLTSGVIQQSQGATITLDNPQYVKLSKDFGHNTATRIKAIGRYESENLQKVYWIDGDSLKFVNLADRNIQSYPVSKFESFPEFDSGIIFTEITTGNLQSGRVQYTYQLYNVNGSSTLFGPVGEMLNLSSSVHTTTDRFRGSDVGENTGKGANVQIDNIDTNYDRIRLFRIHYGDINLDPSMYLIEDRAISRASESFTDGTEVGMGQVDLAEFISTRADISAETIETKNNILFQGNTTEKVFDVEYGTNNVTWRFIPEETPIDNTPSGFKHTTTVHTKPSFQKDEIYRFGIVLFDEKFKSSFVKPIADIKIPDGPIIRKRGGITNAESIAIEFTPTNLPESVKAFQIVYVQRDRAKRSVIDTGFVSRMIDFNNEFEFFGELGRVEGQMKINPEYLEYTSAEYLYGDIRDRGQKIEMLSEISEESTTGIRFGENDKVAQHFKYVQNSPKSGSANILNAYYHRGVDDVDLKIPIGAQSVNNGVTNRGLDRKGTKGATTILRGELTSLDDTPMYYARRRKNLGGDTGRDVRGNVNFYGPVESNVFVPCSPVDTLESVRATGDVYINFMEFVRILYPLSMDSGTRYMQSIALPVESTINLQYISNPTVTSLINIPLQQNSPDHYLMQEQSGVHIRGTESTYVQTFNLYTYNSAYSRQFNIKPYVVRPETLRDDNTIDTRVYHSERKINAELEDGWLVFRQFLDVDTAYGKITRLYNFKNTLYFFQPQGIGVLSVDQRELSNTDSISALTLGVGGILDRHDYITTESGTKSYDSITSSTAGIYYFDNIHKSINRLGELPQSLSNMFGMKSFVKDLNDVYSVYNPRYNTILFKTKNKLLEFSEALERFTGFYTCPTTRFIGFKDNVFTVEGNRVYQFDEITSNGVFNNNTSLSNMSFVIKPDGRFINRLDIIELLTYVLQNNTELAETISRFKVHNSYQDTGWIDVKDEVAVRRMRHWRINHLRDEQDEGRLKDSYHILEIEFSNENNKTIQLSDIIVTYFPVRPY